MTNSKQAITLITCSYGPDFERCQRMCRSADQWVDSSIKHLLIVPARDRQRFLSLETTRRSVLAVEDVVPAPFWQLPMTQRWWTDEYGWPVRGWIMQQVTKLSANFATDAEHIVFVDSDLQFINPFTRQTVLDEEGRLRLHRQPGAKQTGEHLRWHHRAADLLGVERRYFGADFIGQLISWRRSHLVELQAQLEYANARPWYRSVSRSLGVSEYILYGAYIESFVGQEHSRHYRSEEDLCHCCWFLDEAEALAKGTGKPRRDAVAVLVQSNLGLSADAERRVLRRFLPTDSLPMEAFS